MKGEAIKPITSLSMEASPYLIENVRGGHGVGYGLLEEFLARQRSNMANKLIPDPSRAGRILDIGCGAYPFFLLKTQFAEKYGLDRLVSDQDVQRFQQRAVTLRGCDLQQDERLPFENDYLDVVTMLAVFEHLEPERLVSILREIHRVLRPGGLYIMTTPPPWTERLLHLMAVMKLVSGHGVEEHKDAYNSARIRALLCQGGFLREHIRCGYFELFMNLWATARK